MKVVFLTAGAAGMYCGSCMHDNALAKAMRRQDVDCVLQPVYTPIRTDADSMASEQVFFGGIHIYLLNKFPWLRHLPVGLRRWMDRPTLLKWATKNTGSTDAAELGKLAVSMLRGSDGYQNEEVERLTDWLADEMKPDAIVLSNLLIGGALPQIRKRLPNAKLIVVLQGDDIFLDHLPETYRSEAIHLCSQLAPLVDQFIVNSRFYGDKMGALLGFGPEQWTVHPLSIDLEPFGTNEEPLLDSMADEADTESEVPFRLGYLARIAPEKGLHRLVDAFIRLAKQPSYLSVQLHVAGWLGAHNEAYFADLVERIEKAGLSDRFFHHGSPKLAEKITYLKSLDLLCVPTDYEDPKGLFVLEALAAGVPVLQPDHGAFGELIESTGGGLTFPPDDIDALNNSLARLIDQPTLRQKLADQGRQAVKDRHSINVAAERLIELVK